MIDRFASGILAFFLGFIGVILVETAGRLLQ
jgi:hypothetical protein